MGFLEFVQNNLGHVMPLFLAGAFAAAVVLERTKTLFFTYPMRNPKGFFDKVTELTFSGRTGDVVALCDQYPDKPLANVVKAAMLKAHLPEPLIEHGLQYALGESTHKIQKRTAFLATIANVATLMGLFGTILGLVHSFEAVGHADAQQKSAMLAMGIATAMNATMLGLGVAIPCMVAFSFLMNRSNALVAELENSAIKTLEIIKHRYYAVDFGQQAANGETSNPRRSHHLRQVS